MPIEIPPPRPRAPNTVGVIPRRKQTQMTAQRPKLDHVVAGASVTAVHAGSTPAMAPAVSTLMSSAAATAAFMQIKQEREDESDDCPANAKATPLSAKQTKKVRFMPLPNEPKAETQEMKQSTPNKARAKAICSIDFDGGNVAPQFQARKPSTPEEDLVVATAHHRVIRGLGISDKKGKNLQYGTPGKTVGVQEITFLDPMGVCVTQENLPTLREQTGPRRKQAPLNLDRPHIQTQYLPETTARFWAKKPQKYGASSVGHDGRMEMQALEDGHGDMVPDPPQKREIGVDANAVVVQDQEMTERDGKNEGAEFSLNGCDAAKMWRVEQKKREKCEEAAIQARYANLADSDSANSSDSESDSESDSDDDVPLARKLRGGDK